MIACGDGDGEAVPALLSKAAPGRIWLGAYPPGVPADIDVHAYASLDELFGRSCRRFADRTAFSCLGGALTYAEIDRLSTAFAAFLQHDLALARGERIAIMLPNLPQYPVAVFGALRAGLIVVSVNPLYTPDELAHQLADSGAAAIVVLENFAHTVEQALDRTRVRAVVVTGVSDLLPWPRRPLVEFVVKRVKRAIRRWRIPHAIPFRTALARGRGKIMSPVSLGPDDVAFLQYTGGTTGRPKGAVLTHGNLVANVEQIAAWMSPLLEPGAETVVTALPLYHIFALTANLLLFVKLGGRNVLVPDARDMHALVRTLRTCRATCMTGVNTLFKALLEAPGFAGAASALRGTLRLAVAGGMGVEPRVAECWQRTTGVALVEGYGLTEASPVVCANRVDSETFTGTLGLPLPSTCVRIRRENGSEADLGESGEICVHGPQVMRGYWNAPDETAQAFTADGWLRTGDIGRMDEKGYVQFVDRSKDVIVVSGFKAFPSEIESVVMQHPGVKDVGAAAVPDERTGEAVALYVVGQDPLLDEAALREHCARHLTPYKRPKHIEFRERLPKSPLGKTLRRALARENGAPDG